MSLLLLFEKTVAPAFAFVQKAWTSTAGTGTTSPTTLSLPSVGAGNLVVVSVDYLGTTAGFTISITDGNGHSFTLTPNSPFQYNAGAPMVWLGYILSAASGTMTITVTPSSARGLSVHAAEFSYSGVASFDSDAGAFSTTGTTPIKTPGVTPVATDVLYYATAIGDPAGTGAISGVTAPWTEGTRGVIASDSNNSSDAYILGASGTIPVGWTVSSSTATGWVAAGMTIKAAASGGALVGTVAASSSGTASLSGNGALSATSPSASIGTASLRGTGAIVGTAAGSEASTATLSGTAALSGTTPGATFGASSLTGSGTLTGSTAGSSVNTSQVSGSGALVGSSFGFSVATATFFVPGLAATCAGFSVCSALPSGSGALTGFTPSGNISSGVLTGTVALSGTSPVSSNCTGLLTASGFLVGSSFSASIATAVGMIAQPGMSGTAVGLCFANGILTATGQLIGTASGATANSAILSGLRGDIITPARAGGELAIKQELIRLWGLNNW